MTIFNYKTHFTYLRGKLELSKTERGIKSKVAAYLNIQPAFLSQVLKEKHCLSLEQADLANKYFAHTKVESEFFILLVSKDRSGTQSLKKYYQEKIDEILQKQNLIVERLGIKREIDDSIKSIYYSTWVYSAVHVACTIPELRTSKAIAIRLNLPEEIIKNTLDFLFEKNILKKEDNKYLPTNNWVRLGKHSPFIGSHHQNWRIRAASNIAAQKEQDLHFSGIYSIDLETAKKIKTELMSFLVTQQSSIEKAKEVTLFSLGLDFFEI